MESFKDAKTVWKYLNGAICIYKPPRISWRAVSRILRARLCMEINPLVPNRGVPYDINRLVVGPLIYPNRIPIYSSLIDYYSSGVSGLKSAWNTVCTHHRRSPLKVYQVKGRLGIATDTFDMLGDVRERANHHHVTKEILDKVVSTVQSTYQRSMYDACGLPLQSQAAYELAVGGLIRPADPNLPVFYSLKCIEFEQPEFTLEVQCIHETAVFLKRLIHELGFRLRTVATCSGIRCIRYGPFTVEHALAKHNWKLSLLLDNMEETTKMLITDLTSKRMKSPHLQVPTEESWEETERKLLKRGILRKPQELNSGDNTEESAELIETNKTFSRETDSL